MQLLVDILPASGGGNQPKTMVEYRYEIVITVAVTMFVWGGTVWYGYDRLLGTGEFSKTGRRKAKISDCKQYILAACGGNISRVKFYNSGVD